MSRIDVLRGAHGHDVGEKSPERTSALDNSDMLYQDHLGVAMLNVQIIIIIVGKP